LIVLPFSAADGVCRKGRIYHLSQKMGLVL
jgi:hypothetical protein